MGTTLREALESAVSEAEVTDETVTTEVSGEPVAAPSEPVRETDAQREERLRDEKGRFVAGSEVKAPVEKTEIPQQAAAQPEVKPLQRPSSWEKGMWPIWDKLNTGAPLSAIEARQLAEYSNKREGDYAKGVSTYKTEYDTLNGQAKPILEAIAPFMPELQRHGIKAESWITNLGRAHHSLATGDGQTKLSMFAKLAQDYGVPLQALYDPAFAQQFVQSNVRQQPQVTQPGVEQLVQQKFDEYRNKQTIADFEREAPTKYPHYEVVRPKMAQLLEVGLAQDLPSAYEQAVRLHDDLWQSDQHAKREADEKARLEQQRKAVLTAKGNAVSVKSATPAGAVVKPKGLRAQLEEAVETHASGRV